MAKCLRAVRFIKMMILAIKVELTMVFRLVDMVRFGNQYVL